MTYDGFVSDPLALDVAHTTTRIYFFPKCKSIHAIRMLNPLQWIPVALSITPNSFPMASKAPEI